MMKHAHLNLLFICSVLTMLPRAGFAQDTDSDNGITASITDWVEIEMDLRDQNTLELEPFYDDEDDVFLKFSQQDCYDNIQLTFNFTINDDNLLDRGDVHLFRGEDCDNDSDFDDCVLVASETPSSGYVSISNVALREIFDEVNCSDSGVESRDLWVAILDNTATLNEDDGDRIKSIGTATVDFEGPAVTTDIRNWLVGNNNVEVQFNTVNSATVKGYAAFYAQTIASDCADGPFAAGQLPVAATDTHAEISGSDDETSIKISGLENDAYYQVAVVTLDVYGNPSALSAPICAAPQDSIGIGDAVETDGEFCFIATAAFDSYDHPTVRVLRVFRDSFLRKMPAGNAIIAAYYAVGPGLAGLIQGDAAAKEMVRSNLGLFAELTKGLVLVGPVWVLFGLFGAMLLGLVLGLAAPVRRRSR
jgi:hypothetical protein